MDLEEHTADQEQWLDQGWFTSLPEMLSPCLLDNQTTFCTKSLGFIQKFIAYLDAPCRVSMIIRGSVWRELYGNRRAFESDKPEKEDWKAAEVLNREKYVSFILSSATDALILNTGAHFTNRSYLLFHLIFNFILSAQCHNLPFLSASNYCTRFRWRMLQFHILICREISILWRKLTMQVHGHSDF